MADPNLFRKIGDLAAATDAQDEVDDDDVRLTENPTFDHTEGDEREVQQIESLCMNCHENVSVIEA